MAVFRFLILRVFTNDWAPGSEGWSLSKADVHGHHYDKSNLGVEGWESKGVGGRWVRGLIKSILRLRLRLPAAAAAIYHCGSHAHTENTENAQRTRTCKTRLAPLF